MAVFLPGPFGPSKPSILPGFASKEQLSRATTFPARLVDPFELEHARTLRGHPEDSGVA